VSNIDGKRVSGELAIRYAGNIAVEANCDFAQGSLNASGTSIAKIYTGQCAELQKELTEIKKIVFEGASLKFDSPMAGRSHRLTITSPSGHTVVCSQFVYFRTD
jgi:hypothetical protein